MATFNFCFIVEILEETSVRPVIDPTNPMSLSDLLRVMDAGMTEADVKCNDLMKQLHDKYFPEISLEIDGNGYNVPDRIRENFYIVVFTDPDSAKSFLEKMDKILYDFRDTDTIRMNGSSAYITKEFFAKRVQSFGQQLVAYDLLKNLEF
jgi:hypothetical protein